ncbi:hypothetical protein RP20_CCG005682 [Aedes albopictus]|nr:hypothetical protein RP20_CCG005682 [Aedes albopictus]
MTSVDRYVDRRHLQTNWLIQHSSQTSKEVLVRYRRMVPPLPCVAAGDSLQQCRPSRPVSNVVDSASPNNPPSPAQLSLNYIVCVLYSSFPTRFNRSRSPRRSRSRSRSMSRERDRDRRSRSGSRDRR